MAKERRRASVEWTRLVGIVFVLLAISLASDPDYPLRPEAEACEAAPAPTSRRSRLDALCPSGPVAADALEFSWGWTGPTTAWRLWILDAGLDVVWQSPETTATRIRPPAAVAASLQPGDHYWRVETEVMGERVRCSPVLFTIAEHAAGPR